MQCPRSKPKGLKLSNKSYNSFTLHWSCVPQDTVYHHTFVILLITPLLLHLWLVYLWSLHLCLSQNIKISPLSHFLSTLIWLTLIGFSRTAAFSIEPGPGFFIIFRISLSSSHSIMIHECNFLFDFTSQVFKNKLFNFYKHYKSCSSIPSYCSLSSHTISLF